MTRANRIGIVAGFLAVASGGWPAPAADPVPTLRIGMIQGMFRDVQPALVQAMSRPFRDVMNRYTGYAGEVSVVADPFALAAQLRDKQVDLAAFHGFEFAWVRAKNADFRPLVVAVPAGRKVQACVVVHKDSPAVKLGDLKDESVVIPRGAKAHSLLFLDRSREALPATTARPKLQPGLSAEDALNGVLLGESAAALVDAAALSGYDALQPGASKNVRVLAASDPFPPTVIAYRQGAVDEDTLGKLRAALTQAHTTTYGRPLMMMWNLKGFEDPPGDLDGQLAACLKLYPAK